VLCINLTINGVICLNSIDRLVSVMDKMCVICEVGIRLMLKLLSCFQGVARHRNEISLCKDYLVRHYLLLRGLSLVAQTGSKRPSPSNLTNWVQGFECLPTAGSTISRKKDRNMLADCSNNVLVIGKNRE
jgi:hypothetical protein